MVAIPVSTVTLTAETNLFAASRAAEESVRSDVSLDRATVMSETERGSAVFGA